MIQCARMNGTPELRREVERPEPSISVVDPDVVFAWAERLIKEREAAGDWRGAARLRWGIGNIITRTAPGAEKADEGLFLKEGDREVGAAVLAPEHLIGVFVLPEFQRLGYGRELIEASIRRLLERGAKKILIVRGLAAAA